MGQTLHWEGNGGEQDDFHFALELFMYIYICMYVYTVSYCYFPPLFERKICSNWPVSSFSLAWHEITPCISMGGWGYYMRMKIFLFPHLYQQNVSDSRENEKLQLFFEVNIKLLCGRHKIFQLALDVTRIVMKCLTFLMCLRIFLHEGHSGHMVSSNCQETFADFAWEVSV